MDIGKHKDDYTYYEGFEDEGEIVITIKDVSYHIWDGYFEDIFGKPLVDESGWKGFTRDYNEFINAFSENCIECAIMPKEYLQDAISYLGQSFSYEESITVLEYLIAILEKAEEEQESVLIQVK